MAKEQFMKLMGASESVIADLTPSQRLSVGRIIDYMNPVSLRSPGVTFDNTTELPGERIAAIMAPTLVLHARDDTLQMYHNAEFAARTIPDAKLVSFEHGGHIVVVVEQATIRTAVRQHILTHAPDLSQ
jgi:pimeloyl-ACP methyl ester carboxylesterase